MTRSLTILGSTGSIGQSTLRVIEQQPEKFTINALTANGNAQLLATQAIKFKAKMAVIADHACYDELKECLAGTGIMAAAGDRALIEAASSDNDIVMAAIMGSAGLAPVVAAIRNGADIALANKECLVCAGELLMQEAAKHQVRLLPVDSEHNAIFQIFDTVQAEKIERITLTASGGTFRKMTAQQMAEVTPEQAVCHPNWQMGAKISVDSATMMNKGLELIEAFHLFPLEEKQIDIIIHPESVIHGMVTYKDGSVLAQMSPPDMCIPIACALNWPERSILPTTPLNLMQLKKLTFEEYDHLRFPAPMLARQALNAGGTAALVLNAANEVAVEHFISHHIGFLDIVRIVEDALRALPHQALPALDDIGALDREMRKRAATLINKKAA